MWYGDKDLTQDKVIAALKKEFQRRKQNNPKYSIRAFARYLEVDHSTLAKILRGQRGLSWQTALRILDKIDIE